MSEFDSSNITQAVIDRMAECRDPRLKQVLTSLVTHLHDFIREVRLTETEWLNAIQFLTAVGKTCTDKRQEFILLSDTLGASILTITLNHPSEHGSAESTVLGPYYWEGAPELPLGSNLAQGVRGEPTFYSGRVLDVEGRPIAGALLDIWSGDGEGNYDMQLPGQTEMRARGKIRTDGAGRYWFRSIRPNYYPVPTDGPVGDMLRATGRHPYRPGHIHMIVSAQGYEPVTTHLFVAESPYIDSDTVFGLKDSLVVTFERHPAGRAPTGETMAEPYCTAQYDFRLRRKAPAA
ncbi:MAG TPA: intradiol ring-cleavage dioxygenase [Steroidobacteraceae bacterium]|nr:intradiol ring-cleavage dioxygenase [Steroidobacteraceae bacterium]